VQYFQVDSELGDVRENLLRNLTAAVTKPPDAMLVAAQMADRTKPTKAGAKPGAKPKVDQTAKRKHQITYLAHLVSITGFSVETRGVTCCELRLQHSYNILWTFQTT